MGSYNIQHSLPYELTWAIRRADVLTGEFLRPISAEKLSRLEVLGLASVTDEALTPRGMAVRSWLMSGSERASEELSRVLLEQSNIAPPAGLSAPLARHRADEAAPPASGDQGLHP